MIPAAFAYRRAGSVDEAVGLLAVMSGRVSLLAGGQSLLPALKTRTRRAELVLDIGRLSELCYIHDRDDHVAIGAVTPHAMLAADDLLARRAPLLRAAAAAIADPQVRHMGTIGGSLAHADPAADLAVAGLALAASAVLRGPRGDRVLPLDGFFLGTGRTAMSPDELLVEVRVPAPAVPPMWSYQKFHRDALEWAVVGVAAVSSAVAGATSGATAGATAGSTVRVALSGMGATVLRARAVEAALRAGSSASAAAEHADEGTDPPEDIRASAEYRRHLARVLVRRALTEIEVRHDTPAADR